MKPSEDVGFGVYVHVPFCRHRCDYCAFATFTDRDELMGDYLTMLAVEIDRARDIPEATSIFVGGGTPTRVSANALVEALRGIRRADECEFTVECNPDDVTAEMMRTFAAGGVNRLSFGVQSMKEHVLASLGRTHDPANVVKAVSHARAAGIDDINVDIIYGAHGESLDDWRHTVRAAIELGPTHVSAYGLTVESGTPLADDPARHPDDDVQAEMYEAVDEMLTEAGFVNYEVSNWARPGRECRHNQVYWAQGNYHGFGSAAHSHRSGRRWWNVRTPERYIEALRAGRSAESAGESLDEEARRIEGLQLALRTAVGVPREAFSEVDHADLGDLLELQGTNVRLTRRGRLLANEVALRLR